METKSRYEVISDLEEKKREFIKERDSFDDQVRYKLKQIKLAKRQIEDMEEDMEEYEKGIDDRKLTIIELIKSVDASLERLGNMSQSQKK